MSSAYTELTGVLLKEWKKKNSLDDSVGFQDMYQINGDGYKVWHIRGKNKKNKKFTVEKPFCQDFL